ncbi:MAG TPA: hypothetical protein VFD01_16425 [Candidatus Dormibacteraeota bacterium]|jgi:Zn-dependent protease with chaperone function|nr:hypothetical protein [Candidatus Dormibacteraeota bacterium]
MPSSLTPDPKDDPLVAPARAAEVGHVVCGDPHLSEAAGWLVLTPAAFVERLERRGWSRS